MGAFYRSHRPRVPPSGGSDVVLPPEGGTTNRASVVAYGPEEQEFSDARRERTEAENQGHDGGEPHAAGQRRRDRRRTGAVRPGQPWAGLGGRAPIGRGLGQELRFEGAGPRRGQGDFAKRQYYCPGRSTSSGSTIERIFDFRFLIRPLRFSVLRRMVSRVGIDGGPR